jgi:hypothetical protein
MWSHWDEASREPRLVRTSFWRCLLCTVALLRGRQTWDDIDPDMALAWGPTQYSLCDFGTQESWDELCYDRGFFGVYTGEKF